MTIISPTSIHSSTH